MHKKIFIKTFGCQMNEYDSNRIHALVSLIGYSKTEEKKDADCLVLNTCHIRKKATEKVYDEVGRIKKDFINQKKPLVIISGCVAQAESEEMIKREPYIDIVIGPQSYHKINDLILSYQRKKQKFNETEFDVINKFDQFQELLESIMTPELMEAIQKMQEALANMDLEKMLEAAENFDYNLEQFEQQLDRFIEMFELAIAEQKINELVNALELMTEEQKNIKDKLNQDNNTKQLSAMQHRQNQKFDDLQDTMKEASQSTEKFSEETAKAIEDLMKSDLNNDTQQTLEEAQQKL